MSARPFSIRAGTPDDAEGIRRIHDSAIRTIGPTVYKPEEVASWAAGLSAETYHQAMREEALEIAEDEVKTIVGFCSVHGSDLRALYVDPAWSGNGVGSALLTRGETAIFAGSHPTVRVVAALTSETFYLGRGYRLIAYDGHKTRGGLVLRVAVMEKARQ